MTTEKTTMEKTTMEKTKTDPPGPLSEGGIMIVFTLCGKAADSPDYSFWFRNEAAITYIAAKFGGESMQPRSFITTNFEPTIPMSIVFEDRSTFKWGMMDEISALDGIEYIRGVTTLNLFPGSSRASNITHSGDLQSMSGGEKETS